MKTQVQLQFSNHFPFSLLTGRKNWSRSGFQNPQSQSRAFLGKTFSGIILKWFIIMYGLVMLVHKFHNLTRLQFYVKLDKDFM